jgi:ribosomal protein S18 acetylase RimI-like enzyme
VLLAVSSATGKLKPHLGHGSASVSAPLAAFLVGFVSQSPERVAYIHFVGVDQEFRRAGLGAAMYASFLEDVAERGVRSVRCVTSPGNSVSVAFHQRQGFEVDPSDTVMGGDVPVQIDYDGPGLHSVAFTRAL